MKFETFKPGYFVKRTQSLPLDITIRTCTTIDTWYEVLAIKGDTMVALPCSKLHRVNGNYIINFPKDFDDDNWIHAFPGDRMDVYYHDFLHFVQCASTNALNNVKVRTELSDKALEECENFTGIKGTACINWIYNNILNPEVELRLIEYINATYSKQGVQAESVGHS